MHNIRKYLEKTLTIEDSDWSFFTSRLEKKIIKKRTKLLSIGEIENNISFISSGIVRFLIPKEQIEKERKLLRSEKSVFTQAIISFASNFTFDTLSFCNRPF